MSKRRNGQLRPLSHRLSPGDVRRREKRAAERAGVRAAYKPREREQRARITPRADRLRTRHARSLLRADVPIAKVRDWMLKSILGRPA